MSTTRRERGRQAWTSGRRAERAAALLLMAKGFRVLSERYVCPVGEIDLVVRRGRLVAFVEVKARGDAKTAAEAITARQRARVARAAEAFLQVRPQLAGLDVRFDAVVIGRGGWPKHIADAWRP